MNKIEEILQAKRKAEATTASAAQPEENKFFSVFTEQESCLELRFRSGLVTFFKYRDLTYGNWHPDGFLDLEFGGFTIVIKGRGLYPKLIQGIKNERVSWVAEANSEMEDNPSNEVFIESIIIEPPEEA